MLASLFVLVATGVAKAEVQPVPSVDLDRYLGQWFQVAAIPQSFQKKCVGHVKAEYSKAEDGLIKVLNSCAEADGSMSNAEGRAKVEDTQTNAELKVTFVKIIDWIFTFGGDYWVIDLAT
ncbi:MAG: hypothetical protein EOP05_15715, partial [Proteobacteria bacterium]